MPLVFYISHPQIYIEPECPVPQWHLSDIGRARLVLVQDQPWVRVLGKIYSSAEVKAVETAQLLAADRQTSIVTDPQMGEIDRSSTGYVTHDEHEVLADALFAEPEISARGWERAVDGQVRIWAAVDGVLARESTQGNIAFVGHGGVGTLLACKLAGVTIDRRYDQPGGGHVFAFDASSRKILFFWTRLEDVAAKLGTLGQIDHS